MFSVGIIIPSWHYWIDPTRIQPLHEMHYATVLESKFEEKVNVSIIDLRGISLDQQAAHINECDLYIYWIMKTGDYTEVQFIVDELRKIYPHAKHAAGGTHVDMCPDECEKQFDAIVVGPGEISFPRIVDECMNSGLKQKVYRMGYGESHWADYPFSKRHYLPRRAIVNQVLFEKYGDDINATCVLLSRGCSLKCAYCVYNVPGEIQAKPFNRIVEEIEYLKKEYQVVAINLKDEIALPFSRKECIGQLEAIASTGIMWRGQTTVYGATEEKLKLASESGCVEMAVGIESASPFVREMVNKKMRDAQIKNFIDLCQKYNIKVRMCLILGMPGEPRDIVGMTTDFIQKMAPNSVYASGMDPFPGSEIYNNQERFGIKYVDKDWGKHAHLLFRFSNEEVSGLPFEYEEETPWGKSFSRDEIISNLQEVQAFCRENNLT
jgi:anaerobic magnesium-protoporphyrin IX monomethyl ester cyclase